MSSKKKGTSVRTCEKAFQTVEQNIMDFHFPGYYPMKSLNVIKFEFEVTLKFILLCSNL